MISLLDILRRFKCLPRMDEDILAIYSAFFMFNDVRLVTTDVCHEYHCPISMGNIKIMEIS